MLARLRAAARLDAVQRLVPIVFLCSVGCSGLQQQLEEHVGRYEEEIAVAYRDLVRGEEVSIRGDLVVHAASTMKVPVMLEVYRQADAGERPLHAEVPVKNTFRSIVDGSSYELDKGDDSDAELYTAVGETRTVEELTRRMITRSSNLATNLLIELVDAKRVQKTIESLGTEHMQVLRGVEDTLAYRAGRSNTATANDLMRLLTAIAEGRAARPESCDAMLDVLAAQEFNDSIPAGLPEGTRVCHKTGWITGIRHDAALVYPNNGPPYVLVVLTRGFADPAKASAVMADIARLVHRHVVGSP